MNILGYIKYMTALSEISLIIYDKYTIGSCYLFENNIYKFFPGNRSIICSSIKGIIGLR